MTRPRRILAIIPLMLCLMVTFSPAAWAEDAPGSDAPAAGVATEAAETTEDVTIPDGWNEDHSCYYQDGKPVTGIFTVDGDTYYADEEGSVATGTRIIETPEGKILLKDGLVVTEPGAVYFKGRYYVVTEKDGILGAGKTYTADGKKYHVAKTGIVYTGIHKWCGHYYYADKKGVLKVSPGFVSWNGARYYAGDKGKLKVSVRFKVKGKTYFAAKNAKLKIGYFKWGKKYYFTTSKGALSKKKGFEYDGGKIYFNKGKGVLKTKGFFAWKETYYYAGKTGAIKTKTFKYKKIKFHPDKKTGAIPQKEYNKLHKNAYPYDKYILIDISEQKLTLYKNGKKVMRTSVVTGNESNGCGTPRGTFHVLGKSRGVTLSGPGYESYVEYWIPFIGSAYGMHDASWRSSFGGGIYKYNGSHGCVNMPTKAAGELYKKVSVGTKVIIRK